jgi:hypothetical protein
MFRDRELMLQCHDPFTGKRKTKSAETTICCTTEMKRTELEYELNQGLHEEACRMSWENFRELFEREHVSGGRPKTAIIYYAETFNRTERLCNATTLGANSTRTISAFIDEIRKQKGRSGNMAEFTIKARLAFLRAAWAWAVKQKLMAQPVENHSSRPGKDATSGAAEGGAR